MKRLSDGMVERLRAPGVEILDDRFEILGEAGSGGMGTVYRARDRRSDRVVAVKVLSSAGGDAERFAVEARALATLDHPAIVAYVAHGTTASGEPYLAMEWLEGESLSRRLESTRLNASEAVALGRAVAGALAFAHGRGVIHRDIKPSNLFLCGGEVAHVKLLDFGVARLRDRDREITKSGQILGTPGYMAPEQARGRRDGDARADLFSLGCVLYRSMTGNPPFDGEDVLSVLTKLALHAPPSMDAAVDGVPRELDALVMRMMAKIPAERPSSAEAVCAELDAIAEQIALGELASTLPANELSTDLATPNDLAADLRRHFEEAPTLLPASTLPTVQPVATQRSPDTRRGPRWLWPSAGALGIAVVALAALGLWPTDAADAPAPASQKTAASTSVEPPPRWVRRVGDAGNDRAVAVAVRDGRTYLALELAGATGDRFVDDIVPKAGGERGAVTAFDARGETLWTRSLAGHEDFDILSVAAAANRVTVGGFFHQRMRTDDEQRAERKGKDALFVASLDRKSGKTERLAAFGEPDLELFLGKLALAVNDESATYIAGGYGGTLDLGCGKARAEGHLDAFVGVLASDGACRFMHRFGDTGLQTFESIGVDQAGRITVAGEMQGAVKIGEAEHKSESGIDVLVAHFDAEGRPLWSRRYGNRNGVQGAVRVGVHPLGDVVVAGWFEGALTVGKVTLKSRGAGHDLFVIKLDASGEPYWSKVIHVDRPSCPKLSCMLDRIGLTIDAAGGAVLAFPFAGALELDKTHLEARATDLAVVRLNAAGAVSAAQRLGNGTAECRVPQCVLAAGADKHTLAVAGGFRGTLYDFKARDEDAFILALPP